MSETKYEEIHQLVEEFSGEMSIRNICLQEKVSYQGNLSWRKSHGLSRCRGEPAQVNVHVFINSNRTIVRRSEKADERTKNWLPIE